MPDRIEVRITRAEVLTTKAKDLRSFLIGSGLLSGPVIRIDDPETGDIVFRRGDEEAPDA